MNQKQTPLYDKLMTHQKSNPMSLHVPGHHNGQVFPQEKTSGFEEILKLDVTELTGMDDLHDPSGVIKEAEQLTSELYGVEKSYFLVNGSTVGNLAMILATCEENDVVLVQRNSHKSILHGLQLASVRPVFLSPEYDEVAQVAVGLSIETVKSAIETHPNAKAIILTNPNYYGMTIDLKEIIKLAHSLSIPVLVDEAHGAHFILESFPISAVEAGADIVVNSAHKTLPAMTMGAYLHFNSKLVDLSRLNVYLQMLQSSSPSYPIMASLDIARYYLALMQETGTRELLNEINWLKTSLNEIPQINVVQAHKNSIDIDPLKVTIQSNFGLNGFELQALLEKQGLFTEMADPNNVLMVLPLIKDRIFGENLITKIRAIVEPLPCVDSSRSSSYIETDKLTELGLSYKQIKGYNKKAVPLNESIGYMSAEMIIPYPPGIPVLMAGEYITEKHMNILTTYIEAGTRFQGNKLINRTIHIIEC
ncbi:aminotransferase class I/II-fold pyridoxal phosphate-dependent enzyme [Bacillus sp. PS06]|uniref:aminotransferase class I/II-fold pyridoxal phosphate-dependent enzyme n=1 Tax=Bacillus sp. PS06 TaxID=2764176 RepID=UPI001785E7A9|nr:aminotransferase class I/II-fold pyridoxal phosphate-dependent enzyme [Bacillus sp. PS06]